MAKPLKNISVVQGGILTINNQEITSLFGESNIKFSQQGDSWETERGKDAGVFF